jgi:uncharacterized protein (TIGR04255 family)
MAEYPHLQNAPIAEAVLDIRAVLDDSMAVSDLASFGEAVLAEFSDPQPVSAQQVQITGRQLDVRTSSTPLGTIYWNAQHNVAVQARVNGFTFNVVQHYDRWETHRDQAKRLWAIYLEKARPVRVTRCALRYINRLEIPVGCEISDYLRTYPNIPDTISSLFNEYFMRIVVPMDDDRQAVMTQAVPPAGAEIGGLILDVDVFVERDIVPGSDDLWQEFEVLHRLKNKCFFESLQPRALEAYR